MKDDYRDFDLADRAPNVAHSVRLWVEAQNDETLARGCIEKTERFCLGVHNKDGSILKDKDDLVLKILETYDENHAL